MKHRLAGKIRYKFDNIMAKGAPALIVMLALLTVLLLSAFAVVVWLTGIAPKDSPDVPDANFFDAFWMSLMRTLDPGTMGGDSGIFGIVMLGVTIVGIFVVSALIGIINNGIEAKLEELRKGRSVVVEKNHTVILGWSEQVFTIIPELVEANRSRVRSCIVILGEADKVEMEDAVRDRIGDLGTTRVVCRSGSPISMADLPIASLDDSRSIIILSPEEHSDPDAEVIKTLLAITNNPGRKEGKYHIVAEIRDPRNMDIATIVGKDEVELVLVGDLISRVIAQTCRQTGLSVVYTELLDFGGDEIYFKEEPALAGKPFGEILDAYPKCSLMGIVTAEGHPKINPPMDTVVSVGDRLIVIAEDDCTINLPKKRVPRSVDKSAIHEARPAPSVPEKNLILGWNWRAPVIITELDHYVAAGSEVMVVADDASIGDILAGKCDGTLKNQKVSFTQADTTDRTVLDSLNPEQYHSVILLSYSDTLDAQQADAKSLITLLHLRDMAEKSNQSFNVVSEMLDVKNRELADVARVDDFIVSNRLISLLLSQISENKQLNMVFRDLFDADGSEIYIKPVGDYVETGRPVNFYTVLEAARRRNEIAIGYKITADSHNAAAAYGVVVNPEKGSLVTFTEGDRIIVIAED